MNANPDSLSPLARDATDMLPVASEGFAKLAKLQVRIASIIDPEAMRKYRPGHHGTQGRRIDVAMRKAAAILAEGQRS